MDNNKITKQHDNSSQRIDIESGLSVLFSTNNTEQEIQVIEQINRSFVQLHFCLKNEVSVVLSKDSNPIKLKASASVFSFNPSQKLPLDLKIKAKGIVISVLISIRKLHALFTSESGLIHFHGREMKEPLSREKDISSNESIVLQQLLSYDKQNTMKDLYLKAKIFELLSYYFKPKDGVSNCPFLQKEKNVEKIRKAKRIIIERMSEPPSLQELADEVKVPLSNLKNGFKHVYGDSVFNFLISYKMEYARRMLLTKEHSVEEIALKVGYSTSSHFIAAFKKKYNITPKKYMGNKN